jgi:hypothetical protein
MSSCYYDYPRGHTPGFFSGVLFWAIVAFFSAVMVKSIIEHNDERRYNRQNNRYEIHIDGYNPIYTNSYSIKDKCLYIQNGEVYCADKFNILSTKN